jgi:hypothetical protein
VSFQIEVYHFLIFAILLKNWPFAPAKAKKKKLKVV